LGRNARAAEAAGEGTLELLTSAALIAELTGILGRAKFAAKLKRQNISAAEIVARYRELAEMVEPATIVDTRLRDPDDAAVLACALAARADAIVTGDYDLHALGTYEGIFILTPAQCLERLSTVGRAR
jgi:uncharacterized protein